MKKISVRTGISLLFLVLSVISWLISANYSVLLEPTSLTQAFVFAFMVAITGVLLFALARPATALFISAALFLALKFISVMKLLYLESPLTLSDFLYFANTSLVETLQHYPHLFRLSVAVCILMPLALILAWRFDFHLFSRLRFLPSVIVRATGALICIAAVMSFLMPGGPFAAIYEKGLWKKLSDSAHLTNFFVNIHDSRVRFPSMSDDAVARQEWAPTEIKSPGKTDVHPDIFEILEESTFDPSTFAGCTIPQCHLRMFQPDDLTRGYGLLRTHTVGGGTWVSEFAVLTGMPQDIFGPAGMYAPFVLAPRTHDALPNFLRNLGYKTIAIYPVGGGFINARNAYQAYGFDEFYDVNQLGMKIWHDSDAQLITAAKRIYDEERKKSEKPIFMMILTLAQHGPHDAHPLSSLPPPYNEDLLSNLSEKQDLNLSTYLARVSASDRAITMAEDDFLKQNRPSLLVSFGDHEPSFGGIISEMPRNLPAKMLPSKNLITYFSIKNNFSSPALPSYPLMDIAYLPSMVIDAAGIPKDSYFSALSTLRERCGGLYTECPNKKLLSSYYAWTFRHLGVIQ